jgi:Protein of unknown function (DUF3040)
MALSDHDQIVLREMEAALRADTAHSSRTRLTAPRASHRYLTAAIGLMTFGLASTVVGLRLEDNLGTGLGVLGFIFIVYSCWAAARSPRSGRGWLRAAGRGWRMAVRSTNASHPSRQAGEGPR